MPIRPRLLVAALALAALLLTAALALAQGGRRTTLLSAPDSPAPADGESSNAAFSQDERIVRLVAFDSLASNLVDGDGNQQRDVFVLHRTQRPGALSGQLELVSVATGGAQGNNESRNPSLDGVGRRVRPHCVAFESRATNFDPQRDPSDDFDVYVRDLRANTTTLVSAGVPDGATNPTVDGRCAVVTFEAGGAVYAVSARGGQPRLLARGTNPDVQTNGRGAAYVRGRHVYHRPFTLSGSRLSRGRERLASRGPRGAGNGQSSNPTMDENGFYVAFESRATNLCGRGNSWCVGVDRDRNRGTTDVFRATLSRRAPTRDRMQMVSYSHGGRNQRRGTVRAQGNADSQNPAMTGGGEFVFFDSRATNLRESRGRRPESAGDDDRDVFVWNFPDGRRTGNVSRESRPTSEGAFEADSYAPATSARGNYAAFESLYPGPASNASAGFQGGADVFIRFLGGQ